MMIQWKKVGKCLKNQNLSILKVRSNFSILEEILMKSRQVLVFFILTFILVSGFLIYMARRGDQIEGSAKEATSSEGVIRLHIIANSDFTEDQNLKRSVRDQILRRFSSQFSKVENIQECRRIIRENLDSIQRIATEEVRRNGKDYAVTATLGIYHFPTKMYGDKVYAAGEYEALRVVIGEGAGQNWWCVMFPPLCFVDVSHGTAESNGASNSEEPDPQTVLASKFIDLGIEKSNSQDSIGQVEYRLKIMEWWENSKNDLAKIFSFRNE